MSATTRYTVEVWLLWPNGSRVAGTEGPAHVRAVTSWASDLKEAKARARAHRRFLKASPNQGHIRIMDGQT